MGGLAPDDARALLERRSRALAHEPVTFVAGARRWRVTPSQLGVKVDWAAAVDAARLQGGGFGPVRGFRRLHTRFFGADVAPPTQVYDAALQYQVGRFASALDRHPRDAAVVLRGLTPAVVPGRSGRLLDRAAAERVVVRALAALSRRRSRSPFASLARPRRPRTSRPRSRRRGSRSPRPSASRSARRAGACRAGGSPSCSTSPTEARRSSGSAAPAPTNTSRASERP